MFANFLIGLREGLEASLVVGILVAYLVRTDRRDQLTGVWTGVAAAVLLSFGAGAALSLTSRQLTFRAAETFGGVLSLIAVVLVTVMVFWMRRAARGLAADLRGRLDCATAAGGLAVALVAFVSVVREGLETAVFLWAAIRATGDGSAPLIGASLGLLTAVALGWAVYRGSVRINLGRFFHWTGAALIVVAAGVLMYGIGDLQEAGWLPGLRSLAFDVSGVVDPASWYAVLLQGTVNFTPQTTWLQAIVWLAYVIPVMALYLRPARPARTARTTAATAATTPDVAAAKTAVSVD